MGISHPIHTHIWVLALDVLSKVLPISQLIFQSPYPTNSVHVSFWLSLFNRKISHGSLWCKLSLPFSLSQSCSLSLSHQLSLSARTFSFIEVTEICSGYKRPIFEADLSLCFQRWSRFRFSSSSASRSCRPWPPWPRAFRRLGFRTASTDWQTKRSVTSCLKD